MTFWILFGVVCVATGVWLYVKQPSNEREWSPDQDILPTISRYGPHITVHNLRQARYRDIHDYDVAHATHTFALTDIVRTWTLTEPFGNWLPFGLRAAHVLLSFELKNGTYVCISPEIRKKRGERFKPLKGFLRGYELMYVVADEEDVIKLRTNFRKDDAYLYPLTMSSKQSQHLFTDIAQHINSLAHTPEFFNTCTNSCTTNIARHLRTVGYALPPWNYRYLFPGSFDALLYKKGLLDIRHPHEVLRAKHYITKKAQDVQEDADFSNSIRSQEKT